VILFLDPFFRQNFLNTLKSADSLNSNQFRILSLSVLGDLFLQTDRGQAEKMYSTAYVLAKKSKSEAFATVCSSALSGNIFGIPFSNCYLFRVRIIPKVF